MIFSHIYAPKPTQKLEFTTLSDIPSEDNPEVDFQYSTLRLSLDMYLLVTQYIGQGDEGVFERKVQKGARLHSVPSSVHT